jgi:hypothetical protein
MADVAGEIHRELGALGRETFYGRAAGGSASSEPVSSESAGWTPVVEDAIGCNLTT